MSGSPFEGEVTVAIVTCSDTRTIAEDTAGAALAEACTELGWRLVSHIVVPDVRETVSDAIVNAADEVGARLVLTCGGTGIGPRDVTPEATADACEILVPGIGEAIRTLSLPITHRAMLSRATAGVRNGRTLVINLPGSRKAATESFGFVSDQVEHALSMMEGGGH